MQHFRGDCLPASWRLHAQVSGELSRILHSSSFTLSDSRLASSEEAFGSGGPLEDAAMWIQTGRRGRRGGCSSSLELMRRREIQRQMNGDMFPHLCFFVLIFGPGRVPSQRGFWVNQPDLREDRRVKATRRPLRCGPFCCLGAGQQPAQVRVGHTGTFSSGCL